MRKASHQSRHRRLWSNRIAAFCLVCFFLPFLSLHANESVQPVSLDRKPLNQHDDSAFDADEPLAMPSLGDASSSLISPQLEREIGESFLKQVYAGLPTSRDPLMKYYVTVHISQLAAYSDLADSLLRVVLIDNEDINAFAAPGGVVGVNAGLFLSAHDVHEYSSVIAHELAHLSQRHFARGVEEQRAQTPLTIASLIAAIAIAAMGGGDAGMAAISGVQAAAQSRQLRYSRTRETEADRIGLNTLMRAGLDPEGMPRMFERMHHAYRFTRRPPEFLLTHPMTDRRVSDTKQQLQNLPPHSGQPANSRLNELDYRLMRVRAQVNYADSPAGAVALFEKALRENPDDIAAEYGLALALGKTGKKGETLAITESLLGTDPQKILYVGAHAESLIDADKPDQAAHLLSHHLVLNPDNTPLSVLYARALSADNRNREAQAVLERQSLANPRDIDIWYELAETAGLAGDVIAVHRARAEFFALHGGYSRAIQHLEYAQRLISRSDERLRAQLDQRIMDLRTELRAAEAG